MNNDTTEVNTGADNFDVTMGSFDVVLIPDLIGLYIIDRLDRIIESNNIGLYRECCPISLPNSNGPLTSKI